MLQDTLWMVKYIANKLTKSKSEDVEEIEILIKLLYQYPHMDSFYLTATNEERLKRFKKQKHLARKFHDQAGYCFL